MLSTERREVMPISLVEYEMYLKEREKRLEGMGEIEGKPKGDRLLKVKSHWGKGKVYPNGVKAKFGSFIKVNDWTGKLPKGDHVVFEKRKMFVPWKRLSGIYPLQVEHIHRHNGNPTEPDSWPGVQLETEDMMTAILVFEDGNRNHISTLQTAAAGHWGRLWHSEFIEGSIHSSAKYQWYNVQGDIFKPAWLREVDGATRVSYRGHALSRTAPAMEPLMQLDPSSMDKKTLNEWCEYVKDHLVRTYAEKGESKWSDDEWWTVRRDLLYGLISQIDALERIDGTEPYISRLLTRIGEELLVSQDTKRIDQNLQSTFEPREDLDPQVMSKALDVLAKAFHMDILRIEVLRLKEIAYESMGDEGKAVDCHKAWIRFQMRTPYGQVHSTFDGVIYGDGKSALKILKEDIKRNPREPIFYYFRGAVYLQYLGKPKKALKDFEKCLELDDGFSIAWYGKGRAMEMLGKQMEAKNLYHRSGLR